MNKANPFAMILSAAMMLDALNESTAANHIRAAVNEVLDKNYRSADLWREGNRLATTSELGDLVSNIILNS